MCVNVLERNREGKRIGKGHRGLEKKEGEYLEEERERHEDGERRNSMKRKGGTLGRGER